jgi:hypothetical protein
MKQRVCLSLNRDLVDDAKVAMKRLRFDTLSQLVEHLLREEVVRRGYALTEPEPDPPNPEPVSEPNPEPEPGSQI